MKTARFFAVALAATISVPLIAQQAEENAPQKEVYARQDPMDFGDAAASHSWEMTTVTCDLQNKLDSKTAKVGDRVVLKTNDKVQTAEGTVIPRGTRLVGHITQVQMIDATHSIAQLAIAFDHAELKNGQSIAIFTLIRTAYPISNYSDSNPMAISDPTAGMGSTQGGRNGGGQPGYLSDAIKRTSPNTTSVGDRADASMDPNPPGAVELAGRGDPHETTGAHQVAAARSIPHATAIPGLMLAGNGTSSGVFLSRQKDIEIASGTQMQLGIIKDSGL